MAKDTKTAELEVNENESNEAVEKSEKDAFKETIEKYADDERKSRMTDEEKEKEEKDIEAEKETELKKKKASSDDKSKSNDKGAESDEDEKISIDESLIERAVRLGMPLRDARSMPSDESLKGVIGHLEEALKAAGVDTGEGEASEGKDAGNEEDLLKSIPDLNPEDFEEDVVKVFGTMKNAIGALQKSNKEQRAIIEELRGNVVTSEQLYVDNKVAELGEEYESIFGKGSIKDVSATHKASREKLMRYISFVTEDAKKNNESISKEDAFNMALTASFGKEVSSLKGAKAAEESRKRAKKTLNAPKGTLDAGTDKSSKPLTEDERDNEAFGYLKSKFKTA